MDRIGQDALSGKNIHTERTRPPADELSDAALEAEFDMCTRRLGIHVPTDLKGGVLRGYRGLREMAVRLRDVPIGPNEKDASDD